MKCLIKSWVFRLYCGIFSLLYVSSANSPCKDEFEECDKLEHLCKDSGTAGINMATFCKATCKKCLTDACLTNNGDCEQICTVNGEEKICSCRTGFKLDADLKSCVDIDECINLGTACPGLTREHCINTIGSYKCEACSHNAGYTKYYEKETCCKIINSTCGYDRTMENSADSESQLFRIFGGLKSEDGKWPWMAQLIARNGDRIIGGCGGSLLSRVWILSAAHCFWRVERLNSWTAILGTNKNFSAVPVITYGVELRSLVQKIDHPGSNKFFHHDISLLRMESSVDYSNVIKPICLPCIETPHVGDQCWAIGFGETDGNGLNTLQEVDLPITSIEECAQIYQDSGREIRVDHMICAGKEKGKDSCFGDSGGPLMCQRKTSCQWYQAGITSFGPNGCGLKGVPGVYTNVAAHQEWIMNVIGRNDSVGACPALSCRGLKDESSSCQEEIDFCDSYPDFMGKNCAASCCRRKIGSTTCNDDSAYKSTCAKNANHCNSGIFSRYLKSVCPNTCNTC